MAAHRRDDAAAVLRPLRDELVDDRSEPGLAISLHRELSRIESGTARSDALLRYSAALEEELWALRESRLTALRSHSEHHRLVREHGAVAAQALQDPLTGLPNRRALDLRLREISTSTSGQPCAIALIDLDRFKAVNDARSHAAGDAVLRAVASALRTALRAQDLVGALRRRRVRRRAARHLAAGRPGGARAGHAGGRRAAGGHRRGGHHVGRRGADAARG
jgi:GGDEF domain-containing protein